MSGNTTINSAIATGNLYSVVVVDPANGTKMTHSLTDTAHSITAQSIYTTYPSTERALQAVTTRQIFVGYTNGSVATSYTGGASWTTASLGAAIASLCSGETAASDYPLAYAGTTTGLLYAYTPTQNAVAAGSWTATSVSLGSSITALCLPEGARGRAWLGTADGRLYLYSPLSNTALLLGQLGASIVALASLGDPTVCYGLCNDGAAGLFQVIEQALGATVFSLDHTQTYTALTSHGRTALLASGNSSVSWSPDEGVSWGTRSGPASGYTACCLGVLDANEWLIGTSGATYSTHDNGQTFASSTLAGASYLEQDRAHPGVVYALHAGVFQVSYDFGASWDALSPVASTATALCQGVLMMG